LNEPGLFESGQVQCEVVHQYRLDGLNAVQAGADRPLVDEPVDGRVGHVWLEDCGSKGGLHHWREILEPKLVLLLLLQVGVTKLCRVGHVVHMHVAVQLVVSLQPRPKKKIFFFDLEI